MKDPEQVRRIELLARAEAHIMHARTALDHTMANVGMVLPNDHPVRKALDDARLAVSKLDALNTSTLGRMKR